MASPSKEEELLTLILEQSPLKQWHFEDFVKLTSLTRAAINKWLRRYCAAGLLVKVKKPRSFPYYMAGSENPVYQARKRLYALTKMYQSGFIQHLQGSDAKTIIIFGSMTRGDWYKDSDIDVFIFGDSRKIEGKKFERILKKNIELHIFRTKAELRSVKTGLLQNVVNGHVVKGAIQDFVTVAAA